jgi:hypothetical protein
LDQKTITIRKRYDDDYYQKVRALFCCLPEIFQFIQSHGIVSLDFGCTTDYGGYPESPIRMISSDRAELERITSQLLTLLSHNTTLVRCNLGLFESLISRRRLINAIEHHPVIDTINMVPNGARTNFLQDPHILWRNMKDGSFYWNHFRHDDMQ